MKRDLYRNEIYNSKGWTNRNKHCSNEFALVIVVNKLWQDSIASVYYMQKTLFDIHSLCAILSALTMRKFAVSETLLLGLCDNFKHKRRSLFFQCSFLWAGLNRGKRILLYSSTICPYFCIRVMRVGTHTLSGNFFQTNIWNHPFF